MDHHQQTSLHHKSSLTVETSHWLQTAWILSSLHPDFRPWFSNDMQHLLLSEKRTLFGPLSKSPVFFLFSPGKMLLMLFLFQKWLGNPFLEDVWVWLLLMHQLQSTPCEALSSVWISFAWWYFQACGHPCCLCTSSYPISSFQSTLHLICLYTALCEQPPLSVTTFCVLPSLWGVSMIVFQTIANSTALQPKKYCSALQL